MTTSTTTKTTKRFWISMLVVGSSTMAMGGAACEAFQTGFEIGQQIANGDFSGGSETGDSPLGFDPNTPFGF